MFSSDGVEPGMRALLLDSKINFSLKEEKPGLSGLFFMPYRKFINNSLGFVLLKFKKLLFSLLTVFL
ncbi:hypothetical protein GCM10023164_02470 [Christiangramia aestuarii]